MTNSACFTPESRKIHASIASCAVVQGSCLEELMHSCQPIGADGYETAPRQHCAAERQGCNQRPDLALIIRSPLGRAALLWSELRKQYYVTNAFLPKKHHAKPVDSHAHPSGRGHTMLESDKKILVYFLPFLASL